MDSPGRRIFQAALLALVALAPLALNSASVEPLGAAKIVAVQACLGLGVLGWLAHAFQHGVSLRPLTAFLLPAGIFLAALFASLQGIVNVHEGWVEAGRWGWLLGFGACAATLPLGNRFLKALMAAAVATGCIVAVTTLMEYSGHLGFFGVQMVFYRKDDRLLGFFGHQNLIAQYLAVILLWGLGLLLWSLSRTARILILGANALLAAALYATYCRSAWVATLAGAAGGFFWLRRFGAVPGTQALRWLAAQTVCIALAFASVDWATRTVEFRSTQGKRDNLLRVKDSGRLLLWKGTWEMILERPWTGWGAGNYPVHFPKHSPFHREYVRWAHNDYLQIASEIGVPGLAGFLGVIAVFLWRLRGGAVPGKADGIPLSTLAAGAMALGIDAVFSYSLYTPAPSALLWLSLGVLLSRLSPPPRESPNPGPWRLLAPGAFALVACLGGKDLFRQWRSDTLYSKAVFLSGGGHLDEARKALSEAIATDPGNAMFHHTLGSMWLDANPRAALGHLEKARRLDPWQIPNLLLCCEAYARLGDLPAWKETLEALTALEPEKRAWRNDLGAVAMKLEDLDTAERVFRGIAMEARWLPAAHFNLANVLAARGRVEEALLEYNAAVVLLPKSPAARLGKAAMMERRGWYPEAMAEYETLLGISPENPEVLKRMAILCLDRLDQRENGLGFLCRSLAADPDQPEAVRMREILGRSPVP